MRSDFLFSRSTPPVFIWPIINIYDYRVLSVVFFETYFCHCGSCGIYCRSTTIKYLFDTRDPFINATNNACQSFHRTSIIPTDPQFYFLFWGGLFMTNRRYIEHTHTKVRLLCNILQHSI